MSRLPRPRTGPGERVYRRLLRVLPPALRIEAEEELLAMLRAAQHDRRDLPAVRRATLWLRLLLDLAVAAIGERLGPTRISARGHSRARTRRQRMNGLIKDLGYAARGLARSPGLVLVVTLTLMLGIGVTTVVFSLVDQLLLRQPPIAEPERVVGVFTSDYSSGPLGESSFPDFLDFREQSSTLEDLAAFTSAGVVLTAGDEAQRMDAEIVTGNFFSVLGIEPVHGRFFDPTVTPGQEAEAEVVLSYSAWSQLFGSDGDVVGRTVRLNGTPFAVIGVAPAGFRSLDGDSNPTLWAPMGRWLDLLPAYASFDPLANRGARWLAVVGRLSAGVTTAAAQSDLLKVMDGIASRFPDSNLGTLQQPDRPRPVTVLTARDARLGRGREPAMAVSKVLGLLALLVLGIACFNVANLLLARSLQRRQELATRLAMGAGKLRLVRQLLTESLLLGLLGSAAGLFVARALSAFVTTRVLPTLPVPLRVEALRLDPRVLAFATALALATGLLFGLMPALQLRRLDLVPDLKGLGPTLVARRGWRLPLSDSLVVLQLAGACVLLVAAGALGRSLIALHQVELGFERDGVLLVSVSTPPSATGDSATLYQSLTGEIEAIPGVESASFSNVVPVSPRGMRRSYDIEGYEPGPNESTETNTNLVGGHYFETLRIPLLRGRTFEDQDQRADRRVAIVNQAFVDRYWPGENGLGRTLEGRDRPIEVIGVVATGKYRRLQEQPLPYVYLPLGGEVNYRSAATLAVRGGGADPFALLAAVRERLHAVDPDLVLYGAERLRDHVGDATGAERSLTLLIGSFSALAVVLCSVGLYGLLSTGVVQRRRELGIRTALGATRRDLLGSVLRRGFSLVLAGAVLGGVAATGTAKLLASQLFGTSGRDPVTLLAALAMLSLMALLACALPARRAATLDPVDSLRLEG